MADDIIGTRPAPPSAYKDRRTALIVFGIIEILIGLFFLLMAFVAARVMAREPLPPSEPPLPFSQEWLVLFGVIFYGAIAALFIVIGVGSIRVRPWARIAMLVVSWLWFGLGLLSTVFVVLMAPMMLHTMKQQVGSDADVRVGLILTFVVLFGGFFYIMLPGIFLLFYHGKNVRATFEAASSVPAKPSPRPLAVSILSWFYFISIPFSLPFVLLLPNPAPFFGTYFAGSAAKVYFLVWFGLFAYFTWEFYWLRLRGWWGLLLGTVWGPLSSAVTILRVGLNEFVHHIGADAYPGPNPEFEAIMRGPFFVFMILLWPLLIVGLLVWIKKHFSAAGLSRS